MKTLISLWILLGAHCAAASLADDFRYVAARIPFLEAGELLYDRPPRRLTQMKLLTDEESEAVMRFRELAHGADVPALLAALKDEDAKVRALAVIGLHWSGDTRHLDKLVALAGDEGAAIPWRDSFSSSYNVFQQTKIDPIKQRENELIDAKTVGDYATAVVEMYLEASGYQYGIEDSRGLPGFEHYWKLHKDRAYSLGWFKVALLRTTQGTYPLPSDRKDEVAALRDRIDSVPFPDGEWTLLSLGAPAQLGDSSFAPIEADLIDATKRLGPERIMNMLHRGKISEDPDMRLSDKQGLFVFNFRQVTQFVLQNARETLRREHAGQLLELEQTNRSMKPKLRFITPGYAIAAADLQPKEASTILRSVWKRFSEGPYSHDKDDRYMIAVALWEHEGEAAIPLIVEWFFTDTPSRGSHGFGRHRMADYVGAPQQAALLKALLTDDRMKNLDWYTLEHVARSTNKHATEPVIDEDELRKAWHPIGKSYYWEQERVRVEYPRETETLEAQLAEWCQKLKAFAASL
jgi:hypothetical protein